MTLRELAVRDLALIEHVRVSVAPGFTVVTAETGAGKSLLIDAPSLVMGGRADPGLIRHGADRDAGALTAAGELLERASRLRESVAAVG